MNGVWRTDDITIVIDTDRMLGNTQPDMPFQRDTLRIRNIAGRMITFDIGSRSFIGLFNGDKLSVTGGDIAGTATLTRRRP